MPADVPVEICKVCVRPGDKHDADSQSISSALTPDSFAASRSDSSEPFEQDLSGFGDEPSVAAPADPSPYQEVPGGTGRYQEKPPPRRSGWEHWPRFDRVADFDVVPGSAWRVQRSVEYGGRLFWTHEQSGERTWRQPLPQTRSLPPDMAMHAGMRQQAVVATKLFFGAPKDPNDPRARTGICGTPPSEAQLRRTCETLSPEHGLYPPSFLAALGLRRVLLCEELHYNGQRRRDVPDFDTGTLYIDVGDRPLRRKRHCFHHELWHMADYRLRGKHFDAYDHEWCACNPQGFSYGHGGKHMRTDAKSLQHASESSQLASAPSSDFLNRYATSSLAEDKAEVWAALMCYQQVLGSQALCAKAALLKRRARQICDELDERWWARVREAQLTQHHDHWEAHPSDVPGEGQYWLNWLTGERRWQTPEGRHPLS